MIEEGRAEETVTESLVACLLKHSCHDYISRVTSTKWIFNYCILSIPVYGKSLLVLLKVYLSLFQLFRVGQSMATLCKSFTDYLYYNCFYGYLVSPIQHFVWQKIHRNTCHGFISMTSTITTVLQTLLLNLQNF